jgi:hypothetical protein
MSTASALHSEIRHRYQTRLEPTVNK